MPAGSTRVRLAKLIGLVLSVGDRKVACRPSDLHAAQGAYRTNKLLPGACWDGVVTVTEPRNGQPVTFEKHVHANEPMWLCVKMGFVLIECELYGDWEIMPFGPKDGRWGVDMSEAERLRFKVVVPPGVRGLKAAP